MLHEIGRNLCCGAVRTRHLGRRGRRLKTWGIQRRAGEPHRSASCLKPTNINRAPKEGIAGFARETAALCKNKFSCCVSVGRECGWIEDWLKNPFRETRGSITVPRTERSTPKAAKSVRTRGSRPISPSNVRKPRHVCLVQVCGDGFFCQRV